MTYSISFDQKSLSEIAQFAGFPTLLSNEVQTSMQQGGDLLVQAAQQKTWEVFANPTGVLADSIHAIQDSPYEVQIGSDAPHARRRELGFVGTDSLGRQYADVGYFYLSGAMTEQQQAVLQLIDGGVSNALGKLGGGY